MEQLIVEYFNRGHQYKVIVEYLKIDHGITCSVRTIKRVLKGLNLKRNGVAIDTASQQFTNAVSIIQSATANRAGYRRTWHILNYQKRIRITQDAVRRHLREVNPDHVDTRIRRLLIRRRYTSLGPNHVWHCDGYDKLKPYGFAIHGCADGFSRKLVWLSCAVTNNEPSVILHYYLNTVKAIGGCPSILRSDCGTETGLIAAAQCTLRNNSRSHIYGPSYRNQRIESWWSVLRRCWTQIWMNLFDDLVSFGAYNPSNTVHKAIAEFCFMDVINKELNEFMVWWNTHRIRQTLTSGCPGGIPVELYDLPEMRGFQNQLKIVNLDNVNTLLTEALDPPQFSNLTMNNLCLELFQSNSWAMPESRDEAVSLFLNMFHKLYPSF